MASVVQGKDVSNLQGRSCENEMEESREEERKQTYFVVSLLVCTLLNAFQELMDVERENCSSRWLCSM